MANLASSIIEPIADTSRALPWNSGSGEYIVSPGRTPDCSRINSSGLVS